MRFWKVALTIAWATASTASLFTPSQISLDTTEKLAVPGENPLFFCQSSNNYSLVIEHVDLSPNPPKAGQELLLEARGTFNEDIKKGAYVNLSIKYGLITLIKQTADLCEQVQQVDEHCPLSGQRVIKKKVDIPREVPPGKYTVLADVYTKDDHEITCLEAVVHF